MLCLCSSTLVVIVSDIREFPFKSPLINAIFGKMIETKRSPYVIIIIALIRLINGSRACTYPAFIGDIHAYKSLVSWRLTKSTWTNNVFNCTKCVYLYNVLVIHVRATDTSSYLCIYMHRIAIRFYWNISPPFPQYLCFDDVKNQIIKY